MFLFYRNQSIDLLYSITCCYLNFPITFYRILIFYENVNIFKNLKFLVVGHGKWLGVWVLGTLETRSFTKMCSDFFYEKWTVFVQFRKNELGEGT